MTDKKQTKWISGFLRRVGALLIDTIILGLIGQCLGLFFETLFVEMGAWGRLIGFTFALIYFGILNSNIGGGQTIGKRLLKIRVVNSNNELISLHKSLARYTILAIPFSLNGAQFPDELLFSFAIYIISSIVFGGLLSIFYLYIFNRVTRQSLHDIVTGTYVVNITAAIQPIGKIWKPHFIVVFALFASAAILPVFTGKMAKQEPFIDLLKSRSSLIEDPSVKNATVSYGFSSFKPINSAPVETTYVNAKVFLTKNEISNKGLARKLAKSLITHFPASLNKDTINIYLIYGFDIGIASRWNSHGHSFSPDDLVTPE